MGDPIQDILKIRQELEKYSVELAERERWLVLNKLDLLPLDEQSSHCRAIVDALDWKGRVFEISAISGKGCQELCYAIMEHITAEV